MKQLLPMSYEGKEVRTITENGMTLWVAKDVATILGYKNTSDAISKHCNGVAKRYPISDNLGRIQEVRVIHEPDLYRLIASSKLPTAQEFEKWIFEEVLPTIRKTGTYQVPHGRPVTLIPVDREFRAAVRMAKAAGLKGNQAVLSANALTKTMTGSDCLELLGATNLLTENQERILTPTEIAQIAGFKSAIALNSLLEEKGLQVKQGKVWAPTDSGRKFAVLLDTGKKHKSTGAMVQQLKWKESIVHVLMDAATA